MKVLWCAARQRESCRIGTLLQGRHAEAGDLSRRWLIVGANCGQLALVNWGSTTHRGLLCQMHDTISIGVNDGTCGD